MTYKVQQEASLGICSFSPPSFLSRRTDLPVLFKYHALALLLGPQLLGFPLPTMSPASLTHSLHVSVPLSLVREAFLVTFECPALALFSFVPPLPVQIYIIYHFDYLLIVYLHPLDLKTLK